MKSNVRESREEEARAILFLNTMRGQYVMGRALSVAIRAFESEPEHCRETSDISDMKYLLDTLFPIGKLAMQVSGIVVEGMVEEVTDEN